MHFFRLIPILILGLSFAAPAAAQWCLHDSRGGLNCGFQTYNQCMASRAGIGGTCARDAQASGGGTEQSAPPAGARPAPAMAESWCLHDSRGGLNCGFQSYRQCMANRAGIGGTCQRNAQ